MEVVMSSALGAMQKKVDPKETNAEQVEVNELQGRSWSNEIKSCTCDIKVTKTENIGLLYGALARAQGTYKKLIPDEYSASGPYASLEAILESVRESLSVNELAFTQGLTLLDEGSGAALLITKLGHSSGAKEISTARVYSGTTDRQTGITYDNHKRIHAMMLLGVAEVPGSPYGSDNGDTQEEDHIINVIKGKKIPQKGTIEVIDKSQYDQLMIELDPENDKILVRQIQEAYNVTTVADLPRNQFQFCLAEIRRIKRTRANFDARNKDAR